MLPFVKEGSSFTAVTFTVTVAASESSVPSFTLKLKFPWPSPFPFDAEIYFTLLDPSLTVVPVEIAPPENWVREGQLQENTGYEVESTGPEDQH